MSDVCALESALSGVVESLNPGGVPIFEAPDLWSAFERVERLAAAAKTLLARRVEEACTWRREGYRSAAEQLARLSGTSVASAKAMLETSKRVDARPATARAMRAGDLSRDKAELIVAAATIARGAEEHLLVGAVGRALGEGSRRVFAGPCRC